MGFRALKMTLFLLFGISSADSIQDELYLWVHQSIEPEQILKYSVETLCDELDNNELALKEKISGQKLLYPNQNAQNDWRNKQKYNSN